MSREQLLSEVTSHARKLERRATYHAVLHGRYKLLSVVSDAGLMAASITLAIFSFMDRDFFMALHIPPDNAKVIIGVFSIIITIYSVVAWKYDWRLMAEVHGRALSKVVSLKHDARCLILSKETIEDEMKKFCSRSIAEQHELPQIAESQFLRLKNYHLRKMLLSKFIDKYGGRGFIVNFLLFHLAMLFCSKKWTQILTERHGDEDAEVTKSSR